MRAYVLIYNCCHSCFKKNHRTICPKQIYPGRVDRNKLIVDERRGKVQTPHSENNLRIGSPRSSTARAWKLINHNHAVIMLSDGTSKCLSRMNEVNRFGGRRMECFSSLRLDSIWT